MNREVLEQEPPVFNSEQITKLKALSINSIQGFLGSAIADPEAMGNYFNLSRDELNILIRNGLNRLSPEDRQLLFEVPDKHPLGALRPESR